MNARTVGALAKDALLYEVSVTPKPGLVDRVSSGAHHDMDADSFARSAAALERYFVSCAARGALRHPQPERPLSIPRPAELLANLRPLGKKAEETMLAATDGANTHKGAVFTLGLLAAAAGFAFCRTEGAALLSAEDLCRIAGQLSAPAMDDYKKSDPAPHTAGETFHRRFGTGGIRAEAAAGFPSLRLTGLPALRIALAAGASDNDAGLYTLLRLIASVEDTTLMKRLDSSDLSVPRAQAAALCPLFFTDRKGFLARVKALDLAWSVRGVSAGGCADLLAAAWFLLKVTV